MTPQEQAFVDYVDSLEVFTYIHKDIWDAACKWQREQIDQHLLSDNAGYWIGTSQYDEVFDK